MVIFSIPKQIILIYAEIYLQDTIMYNSVRKNTATFASETWEDNPDQDKKKKTTITIKKE